MENINYQHPDYVKNLPIWKKCRDVVEGEDQIHAEREMYLKKLSDEPDDSYNVRLENATFYDATSRTVEGMQGMLYRKPYKLEPDDESDNELLINVDGSGRTLPEFLRLLSFEAEVVGRFGLLSDQEDTELGATVADLERNGIRPNILLYKAESIINWRYDVVNGQRQLSLVVLKEDRDEYVNEIENTKLSQYRRLDIEDGKYRVCIFQSDSKEKTMFTQVGEDVYPKINGKNFDYIPFDIYPDTDIKKAPILGLVNMNLSHYRTTARHEDCLSRLVPTLCVSGWVPENGESFYLGSVMAKCFPESDTKAYILEPSGKFEALSDSLSAKERRMAVLGSRMLVEDKKQAEAAETANIRRMGDVATLSSLSIELSNIMTIAINRMFEWAGQSVEIKLTINRDFMAADLSPQLLLAMLTAVQSGEMSSQTFFDNMQKGELVTDGVTYEEEHERIDSKPVPSPELSE